MPRASLLSRRGAGFGNPRPGQANVISFPAPASGMNAVDPAATLTPDYCTYMVNLICDGVGSTVRNGTVQQSSGVGTGVKTLIPFTGLNSANNRLWGATINGIYDFSAGGTGPWVANVSFGAATGDAGYGIWTNFTSDAGTHYGFYADEVNGLYRVAEGGSWAAVADITGITPANCVFVMQHKQRIWMVERGTANAWYLAPGAISGLATVFHFGNKFIHGGTLVGLWTWSLDGGTGVDSYLVALSSQGDVITYKFTDPSDVTTFEQTSQYYIGQLPLGRRVAATNGGEMYLLSQFGVLPMSSLVSGHPVQDQNIEASRNITPLLTADLTNLNQQRGWELISVPSSAVLLLATPKVAGFPYKQYAMSTKTLGWSILNDLEYLCGTAYGTNFYIGASDGINNWAGNADNVLLSGGTGTAIAFSLLTAFADAGAPGMVHQAQFVRPVFRTTGNLSYDVAARFDYNQNSFTPSFTVVTALGALWDSAVWDTGIWGGDSAITSALHGTSGIGRAVGIALAGQSTGAVTLLRMDMILTTGGLL